jgi:hypothetical protein
MPFPPSDLEPHSMRRAEVRAPRHADLAARHAHMAPLLDYTEWLRAGVGLQQ